MKETDFTAELALRLNWGRQEVDAMLTVLGNVMSEKLGNMDIIRIQGWGQFDTQEKGERLLVNPEDEKRSTMIPPKRVARYKPASVLKMYLKTLDHHE
ncbi:MAG: HU family DNA-binding protein [Tannerella sp.]|jgi:nucleoid DNA-binding protein|nr:HU family DNA-binding protein [Tannerella sp.]